MSIQNQIQSETINELLAALSKAQGSLENAKKDSKNPFFKSSYADLSGVLNACREVLSKNGLSVMQTLHKEENNLFLITTLGHGSGQWVRSFYPIMYASNAKDVNQAIGSAITYGRRYALAAICGISQEDDDGEGAELKKAPPIVEKQPEAKISPQQLAVLQGLIKEHDKIREFILEACQVSVLNDIPASRFDKLMSYVQKELAKLEVASA